MFTFGAGVMIGTPYQDGSGALVSVPSPVQFGVLQDVSCDETFETKMLHGANKYPVAVRQGKGKVTFKAKLALINAEMINTFMYGTTLVSSYQAIYNDLSGTLITTASNEQVTPTIHGTALADMGVRSAVNGVAYTRVSTAPTAGQYGFSAASGLYSFSPVDAGKTVFINYAYGDAAVTGGKLLTIPNQLMGIQPIFALDFCVNDGGKTLYFHYPRVISSKISRAFKNDDFTIQDMDMEAFADDSGNICYQYYYE